MKRIQNLLACLLAGVLTLAVLAGCTGLGIIGTVQTDTEQAQQLMQEVDPALKYNESLEYAAQRIADWMVEEPLQLTTSSEGQLVRRVPLSANDTMVSDTVNDFISDAGGPWLTNNVAIAMTKDNSGWSTGYIFVPGRSGAADALREYAAGHSEMGAVFIQYGGETYVVALFL